MATEKRTAQGVTVEVREVKGVELPAERYDRAKVFRLRDETGVPLMRCRNALAANGWNYDRAKRDLFRGFW
jgi:hypothetical protein